MAYCTLVALLVAAGLPDLQYESPPINAAGGLLASSQASTLGAPIGLSLEGCSGESSFWRFNRCWNSAGMGGGGGGIDSSILAVPEQGAVDGRPRELGVPGRRVGICLSILTISPLSCSFRSVALESCRVSQCFTGPCFAVCSESCAAAKSLVVWEVMLSVGCESKYKSFADAG